MARHDPFLQPSQVDAAEEQAERNRIIGSLTQILAHLSQGRAYQDGTDVIVNIQDYSHRTPARVDGNICIESREPQWRIYVSYSVQDGKVKCAVKTTGERFQMQDDMDLNTVPVEHLKEVLSYMRQYAKPLEEGLGGDAWKVLQGEMVQVISNLPEGRQEVNGVPVMVSEDNIRAPDGAFTKKVVICGFGSSRISLVVSAVGMLSVYTGHLDKIIVNPLKDNTQFLVSDYQQIMEFLRAYERACIMASTRTRTEAQVR